MGRILVIEDDDNVRLLSWSTSCSLRAMRSRPPERQLKVKSYCKTATMIWSWLMPNCRTAIGGEASVGSINPKIKRHCDNH